MKEQREILKEQRLKQRESKEFNLIEKEENINREFESKLQNLNVDKSSEH